MSISRERRVARMIWIKKKLVEIIEKGKQEKFKEDEFIAEIMMRFMTSRRIAMEDLNAAKLFLRF